jgi:hypothetical protein
MFDQLAVKKYSRSAADMKMDDPVNVRPPEVLYNTVLYLGECIADLDRLSEPSPFKNRNPSFTDIYSFMRDRVRSIAQDFSIININDDQFKIMVGIEKLNATL